MLVLIKSSPDSPEARRGLKIAADTSADVLLMQDAVRLAPGDTAGLGGNVYAIAEDLKLRGAEAAEGVGAIGYDKLVALMVEGDKVLGTF